MGKLSAIGINRLIMASLVVLVLAVFWPVTGFDFTNFDDDTYVVNNPVVTGGLTATGVRAAFLALKPSMWQPLTWVSYQLDHTRADMDPGDYHLTNLVLHLASTLLLFLLLTRLTGFAWRSAFVAALFAIHPLHVESVAWVAERKDVLSTVFWICTMLAYARYAERPNRLRYALVIVAFVLGLMSKPMLVTLPVTLLLLDIWPLGRFTGLCQKGLARSSAFVRLAVEKIPLFVIAGMGSGVTYYAMLSAKNLGSADRFPLGIRAANGVVGYAGYILKMLWPRRLAVIYPHPLNTLPIWQVVASGVAILGLTVLSILALRRRPYITFGWLWYVLTLLPVSGLVQQGKQAVCDHFTYVPLIGLFVIVAWGVPDLLARFSAARLWLGRLSAVAGALVVAALVVPARAQVGYWHNSTGLFSRAIAVTSRNAEAYFNLGKAYEDQGRVDEAVVQYEIAVRIRPGYYEAQTNLANCHAQQGQMDRAISELREVVRLHPGFAAAQGNLGAFLAQRGQLREAAEHIAAAIRIDPSNDKMRENLNSVKELQGAN